MNLLAPPLAFAVTLGIATAAVAQAAPSPSPAPSAAPSPAPSATPPPLGPTFLANDPCTTLLAIVTRPTVSNSVCTVRQGHALLETGVQSTSYDGGGTVVDAPQALLRLGTDIPELEVDLQPPSYQHTTGGGTSRDGVTDGAFGLKYVVGASPKVSYGVQTSFSVPTGTSGFSAGSFVQYYALNGSLALGPVFSLSGVVATSHTSTAQGGYSSLIPSAVLGASLPASTSLYAEIADFTHANGAGTPTRTQYIGGVSYDPLLRLQLDLEYGFSPTASTGKYHYVGFGVSLYR